MPQIHFETLGCRLNQDESEGAARAFINAGFSAGMEAATAKINPDPETLLCVVNTCTVTTKAEQKARRVIRLIADKFPNALIVVTGCYAELSREEIEALCPERIAVLPGRKKFVLAQIAEEMKTRKFDCLSLREFMAEKMAAQEKFIFKKESQAAQRLDSFTLYTPVFEKHTRASVKIQDGCNNSCTFCAIHLARGKAVSLEVPEIISRIRELERLGSYEVVLTGVNLSQYAGKDENGEICSFGKLLSRILSETKRIKIRVSSFYPQHVTEELCSVLAHERIQPFFHLSIQSGSDRILSLMKRPYKKDDLFRAVRLLRSVKERPFISCDIIAGFPGESEEDFEETKRLCEELEFSWIHAFPYSPRPGTEAYSMKPKIPERVKDERVKWLSENSVANKLEYINSFVGKTLSAVVEKNRAQRLGNSDSKIHHAVTDNFLHVEFRSETEIAQGTVVSVKIISPLAESIRAGKETECLGEIESV